MESVSCPGLPAMQSVLLLLLLRRSCIQQKVISIRKNAACRKSERTLQCVM